jgi:hypothetical protein
MENQNNSTPAPQSGKPNAFVAFLQVKRSLPTWVIIVGILLACGLGHAASGSANASGTTTTVTTGNNSAVHTSTSSSTPAKPAPTATPKPAPKLTTIVSYSGTTQKNTANFHVSADQWQLVWACQGGQYGGNFSVEIDNADGSSFDPLAVNQVCDGNQHDTTIERGSGDFFLKVDADVSWQIQIQATQ